MLVLRMALLMLVVLAATWAAHHIRDALIVEILPRNEQGVHRAMMLGSLVYVLLLALPFVPGAEIGVALLTSFGSSIAAVVYGATIVAMMLSYGAGLLLPASVLCKLFRLLRLHKAAALVERAAVLPPRERVGLLLEAAPENVMGWALRNRYLALAVAVNTPGNVVAGGGGGIMLMAGLSGFFAPLPTLIAILIGVSPLPLTVFLFGG